MGLLHEKGLIVSSFFFTMMETRAVWEHQQCYHSEA